MCFLLFFVEEAFAMTLNSGVSPATLIAPVDALVHIVKPTTQRIYSALSKRSELLAEKICGKFVHRSYELHNYMIYTIGKDEPHAIGR